MGIIKTRWNSEHVDKLVAGCKKALKECKVKDENIFETEVPGSFELPLAARFLALSGTVDAIVTAGVLIKGEVSKPTIDEECFNGNIHTLVIPVLVFVVTVVRFVLILNHFFHFDVSQFMSSYLPSFIWCLCTYVCMYVCINSKLISKKYIYTDVTF